MKINPNTKRHGKTRGGALVPQVPATKGAVMLSEEEALLVSDYRELDSRHERDAILTIISSLASGQLGPRGDKQSIRRILGLKGAHHG